MRTQVKSVVAGGVEPDRDSLTISASGHYPPSLRNDIIGAVKATYSAHVVILTENATYSEITGSNNYKGGPQVSTEHCKVSRAPHEIGMAYFSDSKLHAEITVIVTLKSLTSGSCSEGFDLAASVASAFGQGGAAIGATFGVIKASY